MDKWLAGNEISIDSPDVVRSILDIYGNDYTFWFYTVDAYTVRCLPASSLDRYIACLRTYDLLPSSTCSSTEGCQLCSAGTNRRGIYHHRNRARNSGDQEMREKLISRPS